MDAGPTNSPADGLSETLEGPQDGPSRADTARWLYGFVRPQLTRLALVLALSLATSFLALAQPWITKLVIDDGLLAGDLSFVAAMCGLMLAAALAGAGLGALNRWHYVTASGRILFALRAAVYRHLQTLSPAYYVRVRGGDLMARLDGDVAEVQRFCVDSALALVNGVLVLVGALALMIGLSPLLSLLAFALLPAQLLVLRLFRPRIERGTRRVRERASGISSFLFDTLSAMKFVQSVAAEPREAKRLDGLQQVYLGDLLRLQMLNQGAVALPSLLTLVGTVVVFLAGGAMVIDGAMSLGALVAFTAYLARATGPVHTLLGLWVALKRAEVSLARVREITGRRPDIVQPADPLPLADDMPGEISFHGVTFSYGADEPLVLEGVDATFPAGAKIVVAGASGAGKTTLIDLLQRHYDPAAGAITLAGIDLRHLDVAALRRKVAVVAQDTILMPGTVADNIRYAMPEASADQVAAAARAAGADGFIAGLPGGYGCEVGARGLRLSGGQRQRIAIARAVLQDPLVLILDEATSGVDTETERAIAAAVDRLFGDRTRLVIGHRSTLAADADVTYRLEGGRLVAEPFPSRQLM